MGFEDKKPKSVEQRLRDGEVVELPVVIDELWRLQAGWDSQRDYAASLRCQVLDEAPTVHQIAADIFVRWCAKGTAMPGETARDAYALADALREVRRSRIEDDRKARIRELFPEEEESDAAE